ncbi:MAG TPA: putative toxin-antitoxin system toxin component, PIN family [Azospirillaceae bacterium]|nr:putative toxin-antitoxin system toxin component, PIN family [Azospirillaceae bacterium]
MRAVVDTNALLEMAFRPGPEAQALRALIDASWTLCHSAETLAEAERMLAHPKFATGGFAQSDALAFAAWLRAKGIHVADPPPVRACRDPDDDIFLAVALAARADVVVTRDRDLLALHPFHGIPIRRPAEVLSLAGIDPPARRGPIAGRRLHGRRQCVDASS